MNNATRKTIASLSDTDHLAEVTRFYFWAGAQPGMFSAAQAALGLGRTSDFWASLIKTEIRDGNMAHCGGALYRVLRG